MPFWQRTEGVRANNKRAVLVVYSKESPCLLRCTIALPKKSSVEPDAPTTVQSYGMLFCFSRRSEGMQGASEKPLLVSPHASFAEGESSLGVWRADYGAEAQVHLTGCFFALVGDPKGCRGRAESPRLRRCTPTSPKGNPCWGSDAPTTARLVGCRPEGGSTFFRSERKYQRKHAARRLREKALYCPFLKEGVRNVARNGVGQLSPALGARSCSLFSSFKKGKAFSLRCLSPLGFPAGGVGQTQPM